MSSILINSYETFPIPSTTASSSVTLNLTVSQTQNFPYTIPLATAGATQYGTPPYTWYIVSGSIPAGLTFTGSTGVISGSPTTVTASTPVVFGVKDSNGFVADVTQSITFQVFAVPSATADNTGKTYTVGTAITSYSPLSAVSNGVSPYNYSITSGTLPAGLSYGSGSGGTGIVSGTPTTAGSASVTFSVSDNNGVAAATTATEAFTINAGAVANNSYWAEGGSPGTGFGGLTTSTNYTETTFRIPTNVYFVHVVCIGGGGGAPASPHQGGGGGGLAYLNNFAVTPGDLYTIRAGNSGGGTSGYQGGTSSFINYSTGLAVISATGGSTGGSGGTGQNGTSTASGKYTGGTGGNPASNGGFPGGGGAAGYRSNGGNGGSPTTTTGTSGSNGNVDGGGGGYGGASGGSGGGGGGGISPYGSQSTTYGSGGTGPAGTSQGGGRGGSNGITNNGYSPIYTWYNGGTPATPGPYGGPYGGGAGWVTGGNTGGRGLVRIIYGTARGTAGFPGPTVADING